MSGSSSSSSSLSNRWNDSAASWASESVENELKRVCNMTGLMLFEDCSSSLNNLFTKGSFHVARTCVLVNSVCHPVIMLFSHIKFERFILRYIWWLYKFRATTWSNSGIRLTHFTSFFNIIREWQSRASC